VYGCDFGNGCDVVNIVITYGFACLNECVGFGCVCGCIFGCVWDVCLNEYLNVCRFCNSSCVGYSVFYIFLN
jgi:hypothetical protein